MTDLALVTDHAAEALALLIDQYQGLPRLSGLIGAAVNRVQELEQVTWDVTNKRLLDYTALDGTTQHAVGEQLDAVGRLVGRGRNGQSDATYLIYIRAQIFLNNSRGRRGDIVSLLELVEATAFTYTEFYPGVVYLEFSAATVTAPSVLLDLAQRCVNGGVRVFIAIPPPSVALANTFAFSNYGAANNPLRSFGHEGSTVYGGVFSSEYT